MYVLGARSLDNLEGVHPHLVAVVHEAIKITEQDFGVNEGLRSLETQQDYFNKGVTKTMHSRHLKQPDGFGHAVDLVPYANGRYRWEWPLIYPVAKAMQISAIKLRILLRWGADWDMTLNELSDNLEKEVRNYCIRHPGPDFLDGPHYELV